MTTDTLEPQGISLTPVEFDAGAQPADLYDPKISNVSIQFDERRSRWSVDIDIARITRQFFQNGGDSVQKISLPLHKGRRRGQSQETVLTAPEMRTIGSKGRGSESCTLVSTPTGMRIQMRNVIYSRSDMGRVLKRGRYVMSTLAVEEGCLITLAETRSTHRSFFLVYRIDSIAPWPADHQLAQDWDDCNANMAVANVTLVHAFLNDKLNGPHIYNDDAYFGTDSHRDAIQAIVGRVVDYAGLILADRTTPSYREYFSTTSNTNDRYDFDGLSDSEQTTQSAPADFISTIIREVHDYRETLREEQGKEYRHSILPCSLHTALIDEVVYMTFRLPCEGVTKVITTSFDELPAEFQVESALRLRQRDTAQIKKFLDEQGGTWYQKMYTAV